MEQQIGVRLIYNKEENRWALTCRIRRRAISFRYCSFLYQKARKMREEVSETETIQCYIEQAIESQERTRNFCGL